VESVVVDWAIAPAPCRVLIGGYSVKSTSALAAHAKDPDVPYSASVAEHVLSGQRVHILSYLPPEDLGILE